MNLWPSLWSWALWNRFSLRISLYFAPFSFPSTLTSLPVPAAEKHPHSSTPTGCYQHTLLLGWYSAGDEQSWFPSNMVLRIEVHQTRESCFSESEGPLGAVLQIPSVFSCVFTEERIESGHTTIKPRSVECCSDVCPSVGFSHLHIWSWSSTRVTIRFLVTSLDKAVLHQLLSLAGRPALGRVLVVPNIFHLRITEATVLLGTFSAAEIIAFPRSVPQYNPVSELCRQFLWLHGLVFAFGMRCQLWGLL